MDERVAALETQVSQLVQTLKETKLKTSTDASTEVTDNSTQVNTEPQAAISQASPQNGATAAQVTSERRSDFQNNLHPDSDVQASYASIKASLQSVRLPTELTVSAQSASGLKKGDAQVHALINKCARFIETLFKLLKSEQDPYNDIFTCALAMIQYLQDEQATLQVQNSFDPNVARFFRCLRRGAGFSPEALDDLRSAASIAAAFRPQQQNQPRGGSGRSSFVNHNQNRDFFSRNINRPFPTQRGRGRSFNRMGSGQYPDRAGAGDGGAGPDLD